MKKTLIVAGFLLLAPIAAHAQACGTVTGLLPVPGMIVPPGCVGGTTVTRIGNGTFKLTRTTRIQWFVATPIGDAGHDFILTVRRQDPLTVVVRTYVVGRACPTVDPIPSTACLPPVMTLRNSEFSFEAR